MSETILLSNAAGDSAAIASFGAELCAWRSGGVDLIWEIDGRFWDRTAPVLFPIVGATREGCIRVEGMSYPLSLHGFAWEKDFTVAERREDFLRLELAADEETRALYPFEFRFGVEFRLLPGALENTLIVQNTGAKPLPYACGLHPAFRWPLAGSKAQHALVFDAPEDPALPVIAAGGLISFEKKRVPLEDRVLPLAPELFARDAMVFLDTKSRRVAFDNGEGARILCEFPDFPHIGFWMRPGAPYLCLEPWTGHADPEGFSGELREKPSMRSLAPGASARHRAVFRFERAEG
ncbi:aldose 1-epimerase family protein [Methylocystis bryophila]|uniref:Aldose epimerase n=1 Tax=Methylocystis bryophila TaxID=655015 RepID=A0A1W6MZK7_9HYPH|nr:aldose 1-epimerase family protein [Methylocystis bryophila]ARN83034.1 aldose epimerase [Methylocystis bryophila]BDV39334.1 aldose 1-epimerase [Methylocystis bryophila]